MTSDARRRPPKPVAAAIVFYALFAAAILILAIGIAIAGGGWLALLGLVALLPGSVALGLRQGNRGARVIAITFGFPSIVISIVMILLLAVPESSRAWFTPDEEDEQFVDEDGDERDEERMVGRG
ncbi:hypothetical protein [Streptomyces rapamycinicus]|nr:hypothetical protein [Streptomyces rapamycinicus]MBB4779322.1 membrane-bound ClpP family serine protease [Streptomyces rapamycinicus]UTP28106.1 hypothetical protein LIV37_01270 [Streptomyces rapamycinicus NRRL 5491]